MVGVYSMARTYMKLWFLAAALKIELDRAASESYTMRYQRVRDFSEELSFNIVDCRAAVCQYAGIIK